MLELLLLYGSDMEVSGTTASDFRRSVARDPEALESFGVRRLERLQFASMFAPLCHPSLLRFV